jgi:hypothetical protein
MSGNERPFAWRAEHRNNNRQKIIDYDLSLLFLVKLQPCVI